MVVAPTPRGAEWFPRARPDKRGTKLAAGLTIGPVPVKNPALSLAAALILAGLSGCTSLGPRQLRADQADYGRSLGDAKKREILSMIVGLRFADAPAFINVSNIIAGYTFTASGGPSLTLAQHDMNTAALTGTVSFGDNPTFTFTPTTGEAYAAAYIRPLSPTLVLPLADGGIPIDLLLRITMQSIGGLQNGSMLGGEGAGGSPGFFELIRDLRSLQLAGEFSAEYRETNKVGHIWFVLGAAKGEPERGEEALSGARRLLGVQPGAAGYEVTMGPESSSGTIAVSPRSMLAILSNLGAEVDVPPAEVSRGATMPTIQLVGGESRHTVVVHSGRKAPAGAYVATLYDGYAYWIDSGDFDSKYALTVVQDVMALAEVSDTTKAPVVTIPASP